MGGRGSGGAGRGGAAASSISSSTFLGAESEANLAPLAEQGEITLNSVISSDAMATQMSDLVANTTLGIMDGSIDGSYARMDWEPRYGNPTRSMMTDNSGSGFLVTLTFAHNIKRDIAAGNTGSMPIATARQAYEVGKYKLNRMWNAASTANRAAALKASSSTPRQLKELGLDLKL